MSRRRRLSLLGMAGLLAGSGTLHFLVPGPYRRIVPRALGHEAALVALSGVAEIVCAGLLLLPRTRRLGALATAALLVAVFPANVQMALDSGFPGAGFPVNSATAAWLRLPIQPLLVVWVLSLRSEPEHLEA